MADAHNITAWLALAFGLYSLAAAIGEFRWPGGWARLLWEVKRSKTLQFLTGFVVFVIGTAIYLVNPYAPEDALAVIVTVIAGMMMLKGLAFLAFPDSMLKLSEALMGGTYSKFWSVFAGLIGLAFIIFGYVRLQA